MGKYIDFINGNKLPDKGKSKFILNNIKGSSVIPVPSFWQPDLVCVVENQNWDSAGYAYDQQEMDVFMRPDSGRIQRKRTWLHVPNAKEYAK